MMKGKSCAGQPAASGVQSHMDQAWRMPPLPAVIVSPAAGSSYFPRVFWPKISTVGNDLAAKIPSKIALKKS